MFIVCAERDLTCVSLPGGKSWTPLHAALLHLCCAGSGALWQTGSVTLLGVHTHARTHAKKRRHLEGQNENNFTMKRLLCAKCYHASPRHICKTKGCLSAVKISCKDFVKLLTNAFSSVWLPHFKCCFITRKAGGVIYLQLGDDQETLLFLYNHSHDYDLHIASN